MLARRAFYLYQLRRNLRLDPSKLREMQRKRLRAIIKHAYENVPFYHRKFQEAGIKPDNIKSVADMAKIPMTTKAEIQGSSLEDVVAINVDVNRCTKTMTSGSTGLPLIVISDEKTEDFYTALWARAFFENGLRLKDKMVTIRDPRYFPKNGGRFESLARTIIGKRKYISVFEDVKLQLRLLEDYSPDVIRGYPSSLAILADVCRKKGSRFKPRLVFTGAELLDKGLRKLISSVFECEVFDHYGCVEFSLLMWECREHTGYHMNIDSAVIEFVKNGEAVAPGERGEIVCTTLVNYAMPLIRYRLGDAGIPTEEQCSCGRSLPLLKTLEGRTDDFLTALDGRIISPTIFSPYPFESLEGIRQFKVIQERRDELKIQLVAKESFLSDKQVFDKARKEIEKVFGEGMQVDFQLLEKIDSDSHKLRKVISHVPVSLAA